MALAAEALLRLRTVFDGSGIDRAGRAIGELQRQAGSTRTPLGRVTQGLDNVNRAATRLATGGAIATGAGLAYSAVQASQFQDSLSDIKKALGLKVSSPQFQALGDEFLKLSRTVPVAAKDLAELGGMAALAGKDSAPEILKFAENTAKLGVAFRMPGREAAESFLAIQAQLGLTDQATMDLMGTVNKLSDTFPGKVDARDILGGFQAGLGGVGKMAGLTGEQTAGFYSAFLAAGTPADAAATAMKNFLNGLTGGASLSNEKKAALGELFGMPVDPVRKQLQSELDKISDQIKGGVDGVSQQRSEAIDNLIDEAKFQGKKFIEFEGQTLSLSQAGIIKKKLNSETSEYTKGLKERAKEIKAQLKAMPSGGDLVAADLAKRLQADPTGTIMDVLERIKQLPKDKQAGLVNEIFGKESQLGISAILSNIGLVKQGFDVAAQATQNADSWLKEYNSQLENTSSQFQLLKNAFNEMAIRVGTAMLPVLTKAMQDLTPTIIELIPVVVELAKTGMPLLVNGLRSVLPYVQKFAAWVKGNAQNIKTFFESLGVLLLNLGKVVIPVFTTVINAIIPPLQALADWTKNNPDIFKNLILSFLAVKIAGRMFGGIVGTFFKVLLASFALGALGFKQSLSKMLFSSFVGIGFGKLLQPLLSAIFGPGMGGLMADAMGSLIGGAVLTKLGAFFASIRSWFGMATRAVGPLVSGLGAALGRIGAVIASSLGRAGAGGPGGGLGGVFAGIGRWLASIKSGLGGAGAAARMFFDTLRGFTPQMVMKDGQWVKPFAVKMAEAIRSVFTGGLANFGKGGLGGLATGLGGALARITPAILGFGRILAGIFTGPVGWITLLATAAIAAYTFRDRLAPVFIGIGTLWTTYVVAPIRAGWTALVAWFGTTMTGVGTGLAVAWQTISAFFNTYVITPLRAMWQGFVFYVLQTIQAYAIVWWQGVTAGFQTYVVQPIQWAWNGLILLMSGIGARLASIWATVATNFNTYVVVPIQGLWTAFTTWLGTSITYLQSLFSGIWNGIAANFQAWVLTPIQQGWAAFTQWLYQSSAGVRQWLMGLWQGVGQAFNSYVVQPIQQGWSGLTQWLSTTVGSVRGWFGNMWNGLSQGFSSQIAQPIQNIWNGVVSYVRSAWSSTTSWFYGMFNSITSAFYNNLVRPIQSAFNGLVSGLQGVVSGLFGWLRSIGNSVINSVNNVRSMAGMQPIPGFARGGHVSGPTLAWVGEGKDPGGEYIIPAKKMAGASMAYLSGARGASVIDGKIPGFARGGYISGQAMEPIYRGSLRDIFTPNFYGREGRVGGTQINGKWYYHDEKNAAAKIVKALRDAGVRDKDIKFSTSLGGAASAAKISRSKNRRRGKRGFEAVNPSGGEKQKRQPAITSGRNRGHELFLHSMGMPIDGSWPKNRMYEFFLHQMGLGAKQFATGGYVNRPTLGWIGEGNDSEYVIPSKRMAESAMAYLQGARGDAVLKAPRFARGAFVGGADRSSSSNPLQALIDRVGAIDSLTVNEPPVVNDGPINITTGPVLEFDGQRYVTLEDLQRVARDVKRQTLGELRTAAGRRATGR